MSTKRPKSKPKVRRLCLPTTPEAMRTLRHDLRTPINPLLGYCELIVEEAGAAAPAEFLAGVRNLHALGVQMLKLTNEVFSDQPSALHELDCAKLQEEFCAPAKEAVVLSQQLEQQARAASLPVAAQDLQRINIATDRWWRRIEQMLAENCQ